MGNHIARGIWASTLLIMTFGLVALYSASYGNPRVGPHVFYDQLLCAGVGILIMAGFQMVNYRRFYDMAYIFYGMTTFLLLMVLVMGRHALGAQRWFVIGGLSFQPSELAKLSLILALARYFHDVSSLAVFRSRDLFQSMVRGVLIPLGITLVPMGLIFKQPDLGTSLLFLGIFFIMLFASGVRFKYFAGLCLFFASLVPFAWNFLKAYQKDRLLVFLNPNIDPLGAGYTIIQSRIAIGSGRLFGRGWLAGTQNQLNFLPERHTDFIFSVIGEEWGLAGALLLLVCFLSLIYFGLKAAEQVKDPFGMQLAVGVVGILTLQAVINMGMVMGLCPVVGLTLPLVSYGRSSFMISVVMIAMLLSLSRRRTIF